MSQWLNAAKGTFHAVKISRYFFYNLQESENVFEIHD